MDAVAVRAWARRVLRSTEVELPDAEIDALFVTPLLEIGNLYPALRVAGGGPEMPDLSALDAGQVAEALGWMVGARWLMLPRTEDDQIVVKAKIGELEVTYKIQDPEKLAEHFLAQAWRALFQTTVLAPILQDQRENGGAGLSGIVGVNPSRGPQPGPHPLNVLFGPKEYPFSSCRTGGQGVWVWPTDSNGSTGPW